MADDKIDTFVEQDFVRLPVKPAPLVRTDFYDLVQTTEGSVAEDEVLDKATALLAEGFSVRDIAIKIGVPPYVLWSLMDKKGLRSLIRIGASLRKDALKNRLETLAGEAAEELGKILALEDLAPKQKIEAIRLAFEYCGITDKTPEELASEHTTEIEVEFNERLMAIRTRSGQRGSH